MYYGLFTGGTKGGEGEVAEEFGEEQASEKRGTRE